MSAVKLFRAADMEFGPYGGPPGAARIARLVGMETSDGMGAAVATFDGCSIDWTILYDELIVVLEGQIRLVIGRDAHEVAPGDVIWLPKVTPLRYEGEGAKVVYARYPVDWPVRSPDNRNAG